MATLIRAQRTLQNTVGQALSGALLYVCNQPATTNVIPPTPLATIYSDNLGTVTTNPVTLDNQGNAFYYAPVGEYTEVYVYQGVIIKVLIDQPISAPVNFESNGTANAVQNTLNLYSSDASVVITPDTSGNVNLQSSAGSVAGTSNWMWSDGSNLSPFNMAPISGGGAGLSTYTAHTQVCLCQVLAKTTFSKMTISVTSSGINSLALICFGMYNAAGTSLLFETNVLTGPITGPSLQVLSIASGSYTISPGLYLFAQSIVSSTPMSLAQGTFDSLSNGNGSTPLVVDANGWIETPTGNLRFGKTTNLANSNGTLPSTTGTILTDSTGFNLIAGLFQ